MHFARVIKNISTKPFEYKYPEDFLLTRWQPTAEIDTIYLAYRCAYFLMYPSVYVVIMYLSKVTYLMTVLIYYTHWSFSINLLHASVALVVVWNGYNKQQRVGIVDIPFLYKFYLVLANLSLCNALCVSITYWTFVHMLERQRVASKMFHTWNSIVVIMDFFIISVPFRFLNVVFPIIFGLVYGAFTCIYYYCGGKNYKGERQIYKYLDWETSPGKCVLLILGALLFVVLIQLGIYILYKIKLYIFVKYCGIVSTRPFDDN